jgi:hypothetical protein
MTGVAANDENGKFEGASRLSNKTLHIMTAFFFK